MSTLTRYPMAQNVCCNSETCSVQQEVSIQEAAKAAAECWNQAIAN
jgi:hypothetical protein